MPEMPAHKKTLGSTARWTAAARALESAREDRLFNDPWAAKLAGEEGAAWAAGRSPDSLVPMILRTRYFDDFLQRTTRGKSITQVVLLAAGLDTRAYRLIWPSDTIVFELDQPEVLQEKDNILLSANAQPICNRQTVSVDLTGSWKEALLVAGFKSTQPSIWLLEGFLFYIPDRAITHLIDEVTSMSVSGSWLGFDIINNLTLASPFTRSWIEMQAKSGAPWIGSLDDPVGLLALLGWKAVLSQPGAPNANHGRWHLPIFPVLQADMPHNWYVTAEKV